jgi:hypothetical protein
LAPTGSYPKEDVRVFSLIEIVLRLGAGQNQFGFGTAPREGGCRFQLDGTVACGLRCG